MTESELKNRIIDKILELKKLRAERYKDTRSDLMLSSRTVVKILEELLEVK